MDNIGKIVKDGLCLGCGICQDICPQKCISIKHGKEVNYPVIDYLKCSECSLCLKVCSGKGINLTYLSKLFYGTTDIYEDKYLGRYYACFSGYSTDEEIRYHSASGGCLSQFLIYLLEKEIVNGAVIVGFDDKNPMLPTTYIAKNKQEVLAGKSSKYCVVSYEGITNQILNSPGKYVIVGLPCHIHAFRKLSLISKKIKESIVGYFAIYCSSNRTMLSQEYLLYRYNLKRDTIAHFAYRDNGCLGSMVFRDNKNEIIKSIPYEHYWIGMKGFFNVPRCSLCIDHFGELADVCFGDIHVGIYSEDKIGINSLISRNSYWTEILRNASEEKYLILNEIDKEIINASQGYAMRQKKGSGVACAFKLRHLLGKKNPNFDTPLIATTNLKGLCKEVAKYIMRFIGRRKYLWFIIKALDKNK